MAFIRKYWLMLFIPAILPLFVSFDSSFADRVEDERITKEPAIPHAIYA